MTTQKAHGAERVRAAFDPEAFRNAGHRIVDMLADHLSRVQTRQGGPAIPWRDPLEMAQAWDADFPAEEGEELPDFLARVVDASTHLQDPRYMGHQVSAPLPSAALCDMTASLLNSAPVVYEMSPAGTAIERAVVRWMGQRLGLPENCDGVLTSGGSLANLTALLAARRLCADRARGKPPAFIVSDQAHYSVLRALNIMGWGSAAIEKIPTDAQYHLDTSRLEEYKARAEKRGRAVIGVAAGACSTACGVYDDLNGVADFCERHGLWLHVDGAHGASACLSEKYRHRVAGIERVDSVIWDAHKMMMMPALVSAAIFRDGTHSYAAFEEEASSYLYEKKAPEEWFNLGHRTLECTKHMAGLKVYAALRCHGTRVFGEHVTACFDLAERFAELLREAPDFECPVPPESNVVCFRFLPGKPSGDLDALQAALRRKLNEDGRYYIVQTQLKTGLHLRTTLINPFTGEEELHGLMDALRAAYGAC